MPVVSDSNALDAMLVDCVDCVDCVQKMGVNPNQFLHFCIFAFFTWIAACPASNCAGHTTRCNSRCETGSWMSAVQSRTLQSRDACYHMIQLSIAVCPCIFAMYHARLQGTSAFSNRCDEGSVDAFPF